MKKLAAVAIVACLALVTTVTAQPPEPPEGAFAVDLIADGGDATTMVDVGKVEVWNTETVLYVHYEIEDTGGSDWILIETHAHLGVTLDDFPLTKKDSPKVGQFDCSTEHDPADELKEYTCEIDLDSPPTEGTVFCIAAHASVWDIADFSGEELVVNGDFETPVVGTTAGYRDFPIVTTHSDWDAFIPAQVPGWTVAITGDDGGPPGPDLEFWNTLMPGTPYSGDQYVELDGFDPTDISQDLSTTEGFLYQLSYAWRPRSGASCDMDVSVAASVVASHAGNSGDWTAETYQFLAAGSTTNIGFAEVGADDQLGMLLDTVSLRGVREETAWGGTWGDPIAGELNIQFADKKSWAAYFVYIPLPDLIVTELEVLDFVEDVPPGAGMIEYGYTIQNVGGMPANLDGPTALDADNVSVQALLSADDIFGNAGDLPAGGRILGSSPLGWLNPGETFSGSWGADPAAVNLLTHPYLVLMVDWGDVVAESDESNNTAATLIDP
jgi:hypothetical protein